MAHLYSPAAPLVPMSTLGDAGLLVCNCFWTFSLVIKTKVVQNVKKTKRQNSRAPKEPAVVLSSVVNRPFQSN